jgi:hypothetical protein
LKLSFDGRLAKDSNPLKRRLQFDRHMLITGSGLDQMAASAESDSRSPHAVSGGAAEQILARDNGRLAIKIEGRLPIGMAREYGRVLGAWHYRFRGTFRLGRHWYGVQRCLSTVR